MTALQNLIPDSQAGIKTLLELGKCFFQNKKPEEGNQWLLNFTALRFPKGSQEYQQMLKEFEKMAQTS